MPANHPLIADHDDENPRGRFLSGPQGPANQPPTPDERDRAAEDKFKAWWAENTGTLQMQAADLPFEVQPHFAARAAYIAGYAAARAEGEADAEARGRVKGLEEAEDVAFSYMKPNMATLVPYQSGWHNAAMRIRDNIRAAIDTAAAAQGDGE